jgi:hypothetical protein
VIFISTRAVIFVIPSSCDGFAVLLQERRYSDFVILISDAGAIRPANAGAHFAVIFAAEGGAVARRPGFAVVEAHRDEPRSDSRRE